MPIDSKDLDPDQDQHSVRLDLGPYYLQRLSADDKSCTSQAGLENSTCTLVFTSSSGCRASENFDISIEN